MSALEELAESVRVLVLASAGFEALLADQVPRIRDLAQQVASMVGGAEDPRSLRQAAIALESAANAVEGACHRASEASSVGSSYADSLVSGGGSAGSGHRTSQSPTGIGLPISDAAIDDRTSANRISLADDASAAVGETPDYGGYLDVVMHGNAEGTQADLGGRRVDFTMEQVVEMVRRSPEWGDRPIRLMSCSTGQAGYAQRLADALGVPVYAPSDTLEVGGGTKRILHDGVWRRFEPSQWNRPGGR
jgi:hypothetical protein